MIAITPFSLSFPLSPTFSSQTFAAAMAELSRGPATPGTEVWWDAPFGEERRKSVTRVSAWSPPSAPPADVDGLFWCVKVAFGTGANVVKATNWRQAWFLFYTEGRPDPDRKRIRRTLDRRRSCPRACLVTSWRFEGDILWRLS